MDFTGKKVTVGVTGGIAAYKAADIVSWLKQSGADVSVAMTTSACKIITPLTLKVLSGKAVACDINSLSSDWNVPHIDLAATDLFVVVPATANIIAKAAHGIADEIVSAAILATKAPLLFAPAMHNDMYYNPATQANLALLAERGCMFVEPGSGRLACGAVGKGRLADVEDIKKAITDALLPKQLLNGLKVIVTAGPTHEYIDPFRYISNCSSGKMGYAVAAAAAAAGAKVELITGPSQLAVPANVKVTKVVSARQMAVAVFEKYHDADIVIMAAAVADYRPEVIADHKIKKTEATTVNLVATTDILNELGKSKGKKLLIGFAAETEDLLEYAEQKLQRKNLDLIIANNISQPGAGFSCDTNIITTISADGETQQWQKMSKQSVAAKIIELIAVLPRFAALQSKKEEK